MKHHAQLPVGAQLLQRPFAGFCPVTFEPLLGCQSRQRRFLPAARLNPILTATSARFLMTSSLPRLKSRTGISSLLLQPEHLADDEGRCLHQRTGVLLVLVPVLFAQADGAGEENVVDVLQGGGVAVQELDRETAIRIGRARRTAP